MISRSTSLMLYMGFWYPLSVLDQKIPPLLNISSLLVALVDTYLSTCNRSAAAFI